MDLKYALRTFFKNPAFTLLAVTVMALGIGANTAVFSAVNGVLLKPLPYPAADRIVSVSALWKKLGKHAQASAPDFHDWHDQSSSFEAMAYYSNWETSAVPGQTAGQSAEYARVALVTAEFLDVFGVHPILGRWFSAEETKPGSGAAIVLSYAYWQSHYGGNPDALGKTIQTLGRTLTIVGVLPPRFDFPEQNQIWVPANTITRETTSRSAHNYLVVARLKPGVTVAAAQAEMTTIGDRLEQQYPPSNQNKNVLVLPILEEMVGDLRFTLYLMLGAVGVVLLISCANVANLLLAKATSRTREIAIRAAVGASRGRIVRQLITESMLLAIVAGAFGLLLAYWGSKALVGVAPANLPRIDQSAFDWRVLAFTLGTSIAASLLFGLAPALQVSRVDLNETLKQGAARMVGGRAGRLRNALVVAEIALSVVLLSGAGLLIRSFVALSNVSLGFNPDNVLVMDTSVSSSDVESARRATRFYKSLLADLAGLPGVISAGATRIPPGRVGSNGGYWIDHLPASPDVSSPQAVFSIVTPGAFRTLGIPMRAGRDFNDADGFEAPLTAIINEALAKQAFPGQDPLGRMIISGFDNQTPMKIVAIVGDIHQWGPARAPMAEIYMPYEQHPRASTSLKVMVRASGALAATADAMRQRARALSADVPVRFTTMDESLAKTVATPRFRTLLVGVFAALAVCLAMAGVYGVMAYVVGQRTGEIGLRMALGASTANVLGLVLRQGLLLGVIGLAIGLLGAAAATRLLTSMLFEVKPADPLTYAGVSVVLLTMAVAACYFPARRATRVDPLVALRQE